MATHAFSLAHQAHCTLHGHKLSPPERTELMRAPDDNPISGAPEATVITSMNPLPPSHAALKARWPWEGTSHKRPPSSWKAVMAAAEGSHTLVLCQARTALYINVRYILGLTEVCSTHRHSWLAARIRSTPAIPFASASPQLHVD